MKKHSTLMKFCVTVIGSDRPGIIAAVTGVFYQLGGNLEDASMTILNGEFAMIFIVTLKNNSKLVLLSKKLSEIENKFKLNIEVRKISGAKHTSLRHDLTTPHLISVFGRDRVGIVHQISSTLSKLNLNITDLQSKQITSGKNKVYGLLLEVDVPKRIPFKRVQSSLMKIARSLKVDLFIKPVESVTF